MIVLQNIKKEYGDQLLFEEVTLNIDPGERIGLLGRNGHGKSTLFRMIAGEESADEGRIIIPKKYNIGFLHQEIDFSRDVILDEVCSMLPEGQETERWKAEKILSGLGFTEETMLADPSTLSGGFQVRVELAKVLVSEPDMLLLDEPTNFLDIVSIRWLEGFLKKWRGELMVISHDRNFIDSITTHIVGIHRQRLRKISGTTTKYYDQISMEEEVHGKQLVNDQKKRKQIEEYINSFRAKARRAKSVQSSIKRLDRMGNLDRLEYIGSVSFRFNSALFRPPVVMESRGVTFSYDGSEPYLIKDLSFTVERGDKICIAGPNGKGKTTLAKLLTGHMAPVSGEVVTNPQVQIAYFEQGNIAKLDDSRTVEEEMRIAAGAGDRGYSRDICGAMMFSGDNALKKISVLSGGERSRVLLGKTLLSPANLLVLDEPTHHLDMVTCNALFDAINDFEGAAFVVTHDEYFLQRVATKLIIFLEDRIVVYPGTYSEFLEQVGWNSFTQDKDSDVEEGKSSSNKKESRKARAEWRRKKEKVIAPLEKKLKKLEDFIGKYETLHKEMTEKIVEASSAQDGALIQKMAKDIHQNQKKIDTLYADLEDTMNEYEEVKAAFKSEHGEQV
ncbi:MAG: ATP-binding cassette domain-containing protein [Candidatus Tantalella remota]|nr:ATP-binding cassette domain-containing protein [Candidatus Tantalella remota]